ncbi:hypothetical protein [Pseudonocardia lacus]|uniref:hypothetical protein n=1 Tax=Pseudonocardia lacus TaxID=2835865 RepID=UPI001BDD8449|nr:hypothetical protein [Pseudonocardia lacus]
MTGEHRPPDFPPGAIGTGLGRLGELSAPWTAARAITAPTLTLGLLRHEPGFAGLPRSDLLAAANSLAYLYQHTKSWVLIWAESIAGPAAFKDSRTVRCGVGQEKSKELALSAGLTLKAEGDVWLASASAELSTEWSKLTQSTVRIDVESEFTRELEFDVPPGGRDIALWQLESRLTKRLVQRPNVALPPDPLPEWVEIAIATPPRTTTVLTAITQTITRLAEQ